MKILLFLTALLVSACGPKGDSNRPQEVWLDDDRTSVDIEAGQKISVRSKSPTTDYWVRLDDNGPKNAFFYALAATTVEKPLLDVLLAYDRSTRESETLTIQILWSEDGLKSALLVNGVPEAVFDFEEKRGYCRSGEPGRISNWSPRGHRWYENALDAFSVQLNGVIK